MDTTIALVAEQDALESFTAPLREAGYRVVPWVRSPQVHREVWASAPHLVAYDCAGPGGVGDGTFTRLRAALDVPILVLCASRDETTVVSALHLGADGCLCKPFSGAELVARVEAMLRRYWQWGEHSAEQAPGEAIIDDLSRSVIIGDQVISLTPIEYRLLQCLAERNGHVVTREELCTQIWGGEAKAVGAHSLGPCIYYLRRKLERNPHHPELIQTKWGAGYYLARKVRKA